MKALIVYGSLMAKAEIIALGLSAETALPVVVKGYQRIFAQEPSWRKGVGQERAVLTVLASNTAQIYFSGILLPNISEDLLAHLDKRERGYNRCSLSPSQICAFSEEKPLPDLISPQLYVGKTSLFNDQITPNRQYQEHCCKAAQNWGETFYQSFLKTTDKLI